MVLPGAPPSGSLGHRSVFGEAEGVSLPRDDSAATSQRNEMVEKLPRCLQLPFPSVRMLLPVSVPLFLAVRTA